MGDTCCTGNLATGGPPSTTSPLETYYYERVSAGDILYEYTPWVGPQYSILSKIWHVKHF
jgi:hypothetical protein